MFGHPLRLQYVLLTLLVQELFLQSPYRLLHFVGLRPLNLTLRFNFYLVLSNEVEFPFQLRQLIALLTLLFGELFIQRL